VYLRRRGRPGCDYRSVAGRQFRTNSSTRIAAIRARQERAPPSRRSTATTARTTSPGVVEQVPPTSPGPQVPHWTIFNRASSAAHSAATRAATAGSRPILLPDAEAVTRRDAGKRPDRQFRRPRQRRSTRRSQPVDLHPRRTADPWSASRGWHREGARDAVCPRADRLSFGCRFPFKRENPMRTRREWVPVSIGRSEREQLDLTPTRREGGDNLDA
jgi:hypothetical protein